MKTKIGSAAENGNAGAVKKFTKELGWESTVRNFKKAYLKELQVRKDPDEVHLKEKECGHPLLLGELDCKVQKYVQQLRMAGGIVSTAIIMAAAKGIVLHHDKALLREHGGALEIGKSWAESLMSRMQSVKLKATRAAWKISDDFETVKKAFLVCVTDTVHGAGNPPPELIINFE